MLVRWTLLGMLACAGCDRVWGLQPHADPPADAMTCMAPLVPDADDDHDGVLNRDDACPLFPNQVVHDEDQDGILDDCDLCPQFVDPGVDLDCDGLGAACDPDDMVPHERAWFGFGNATGLQLLEARFANDSIVAPDGGSVQGGVITIARVDMTGEYELAGRYTYTPSSPPEGDFGSYSLWFLEDDQNDILVRLYTGFATKPYTELDIRDGTRILKTVTLDAATPPGAFVLRVKVTPGHIAATLTGFATATIEADLRAISKPLRYGMSVYHDPGTTFSGEVDYLQRIVPRP